MGHVGACNDDTGVTFRTADYYSTAMEYLLHIAVSDMNVRSMITSLLDSLKQIHFLIAHENHPHHIHAAPTKHI